MRVVWKDIVLGAIKGFILGTFLLQNNILIFLFNWLLVDSSYNWIGILFAIDICFPIITALLLNLLPKRDHMLKSILIRDLSASILFIISLISSILLAPYCVGALCRIYNHPFSNADGIVFALGSLIYLGCLIGIELLIILVVSILTAIKRKIRKNKLSTREQI